MSLGNMLRLKYAASNGGSRALMRGRILPAAVTRDQYFRQGFEQYHGLELATNGNDEFLADLDFIRIVQLILVGLENPRVIVCVSVELFCDLR